MIPYKKRAIEVSKNSARNEVDKSKVTAGRRFGRMFQGQMSMPSQGWGDGLFSCNCSHSTGLALVNTKCRSASYCGGT